MSIHSERVLALQRLHILVDRGCGVAEDSVVSLGQSIMSVINCCD